MAMTAARRSPASLRLQFRRGGAGVLAKAGLIQLASPSAARAHREAGNRGFKARCQGVQRPDASFGEPGGRRLQVTSKCDAAPDMFRFDRCLILTSSALNQLLASEAY